MHMYIFIHIYIDTYIYDIYLLVLDCVCYYAANQLDDLLINDLYYYTATGHEHDKNTTT